MGFLKKLVKNPIKAIKGEVKSAIKNPIKTYVSVAGGLTGGGGGVYATDQRNQVGGIVQNMITGKGGPEDFNLSDSERLKKLRGEMTADAKNFRSNLDRFTQSKRAGLLGGYEQAADEGVQKTRENYGRRGLLYSGLAKKGESAVRGQVQSAYRADAAGINQEAQQIADAKDRAAAAAGLEQAQALLNQAEQYYNISAQNDIARRKAMGNLASGLGYAAGAYAGMQQTPQPQGLLQPQTVAMNYDPLTYGGYQNYG